MYSQECSPETPLRCYTGDISGRLGPIDLGVSRKVFTDANFPLGELYFSAIYLFTFSFRRISSQCPINFKFVTYLTIFLYGDSLYFNMINFFFTEGKVSAMGKSIVILNKDFGPDRFACANIEPDNDIIKYANIRKPPRFVV